MNITFVSASAGSGKTHRITEIVEERLADGTCRPGGLIATTFTVKAAQELRDRVRRRLYASGHAALAERLSESLVGTVDSVCGQLLTRFAFEAGISPHLEILAEDEAAALLGQAVEIATDFPTLQRVQHLADVLGHWDAQHSAYAWKSQVRELIAAVQANDLDPATLGAVADRTVDELVAFLPPPTAEPLDDSLREALRRASETIPGNGDETNATRDYLELVRDALSSLQSGSLPWSQWAKLSKTNPGKNSRTAAAPVIAAASRFEAHPRLREDLREYTTLIFALARSALIEYRRLKEERGLLDFADLEQRALHLLRDSPPVRETLRQELDLLIVDEFQDTSPLQLAVFMQWAACAREVVWVGDVKQAIYGFRNSDPELIQAVVAEVKRSGTLAPPLAHSYRSTPELVQLANALFVPAFRQSLGLTEAEVRLSSRCPSISPAQPPVEFHLLSSGKFNKTDGRPKALTRDQYAATVASGAARLLDPTRNLQVRDRETSRTRPVQPRDLAILCRSNDGAAKVAGILAERGIPVSLSQSGLVATPEAGLALACLRRLADLADTLATAEIIALEAAWSAEQWLESRLDYLARPKPSAPKPAADRWGLEEPLVHPALVAIERARNQLNVRSPSESLDLALAAANVFATVSAWGPSAARAAQRRANLEAVRALASRYEQACATTHAPATIAGFLFWCDDLNEAEADPKAADDQVNAVHVGTYHKAKGLEWPVVLCTDLHMEPRPRVWDVAATVTQPGAFDLAHPLAHRTLRCWFWPFGKQAKGIPMADKVAASPVGQAAQHTAEEEELRLLYVGLTRARDLLVLAVEDDRPRPWLESLKAPWFAPHDPPQPLALPDGTALAAKAVTLTPPEDTPIAPTAPACHWFPAPLARSTKLPARLTPSEQSPSATAACGRILDLGARLPLTGKVSEADLGDALHAIFAAEFVNPNHAERSATVERILRAYGLLNALDPAAVIAMVDRSIARIQALFRPRRLLAEIPFDVTNPHGQRLTGFIDLALETDPGWIVIDHKSFPGRPSDWPAKALSYAGQLAAYAQALERTGRPCAGRWIHFPVGGGLVEVLPSGPRQDGPVPEPRFH